MLNALNHRIGLKDTGTDMRRTTPAGAYNERLAEVINVVFGDLSQEQLSLHAHGEISGVTLGRARKGKVLTEPIYRAIARHWEREFCAKFGQEITAQFGRCNSATVADWLLVLSGRKRPSVSTATPDLIITAEDLRGFRGADELPDEDLNTLAAIASTFVQERRKARGLD